MVALDVELAFERTIQAIKYCYSFDRDIVKDITVPETKELKDEDIKLIGYNNQIFLKKLGVALVGKTLLYRPIKGKLFIYPNRELKWEESEFNSNVGITFDINDKKLRFYVPSNIVGKQEFLNYLTDKDERKWVANFYLALLTPSNEDFSYYMASYPKFIYEHLPQKLANAFLNEVFRRNYFTNSIFYGKYGSYLCEVVDTLLNKYYGVTENCFFYKKYKSLDDFLISNTTFLYKGYKNFFSQFDQALSTYCCYKDCGNDPEHCLGGKPSRGCQGHSNTCCWQSCILNLAKIDLTPVSKSQRIDLVDHNQYKAGHNLGQRILLPASTFDQAIEAIDRSLLIKHEPIMAGVYHEFDGKPYNSPNYATYHFIIIVGKGKDDKGWYYQFVDVGTSRKTHDSNNRLYIDLENKRVSGKCPYHDDYIYILTEVRPNK
jgi:hypothetical protein